MVLHLVSKQGLGPGVESLLFEGVLWFRSTGTVSCF